jgi:AcrR family transcriptional regulator
VSAVESAEAPRVGSEPYTAAQLRVATAALDLFGRHGVSGTSLQMIADAVGVTKAAVYHQFKTKEAIVVAATEVELRRLEAALEAAEAGERGTSAVETLLTQVIDLAVERRRMVSTLQHDPVIARLLTEYEPFQRFLRRLFRLLLGDDVDARARVRAAMITAAIGGAVDHPLVADLDAETLRNELLDMTRQFLDVTRRPSST